MSRRQRIVAGLAVLVLIVGAAVSAVKVDDYVAARHHTDQLVINQSQENERHIDCIIAVLFRQDAPKCSGVKDQLFKDGILPPGFPATTTTTRGAP